MRAASAACLVATTLLLGCGTSGDGGADDEPSTAQEPASAAPSTTSEPDDAGAGAADAGRADLDGLDLADVPAVLDVLGRSEVTGNRRVDDVRVVLGLGGVPDATVGRRFAVSEPGAERELRIPRNALRDREGREEAADDLAVDTDADGRADTRTWVTTDGDLAWQPLDADGRVALDEPVRTAGLADVLFDTRLSAAGPYVAVQHAPTDAYGHAVVGDGIEADRLAVVDLRGGDVVRDWTAAELVSAAGGEDAGDLVVFEGATHLWADADGDGALDLLVTTSDDAQGARQVAVLADRVVASEPIGGPNRWRHLLGVADLTGDGTPHVVEVVTPHLTRELRAHVVEDDRLVQVANRAQLVDTHAIGQRDLDTAVLTDVDGDGAADVVARPVRPERGEALVGVALEDGQWRLVARLDAEGEPAG